MATCSASFAFSVAGSVLNASISIDSESASVYEVGRSSESDPVMYAVAGSVSFTYVRGKPLAHAFGATGVDGFFLPVVPTGTETSVETGTLAWNERITESTTFSGTITIFQD